MAAAAPATLPSRIEAEVLRIQGLLERSQFAAGAAPPPQRLAGARCRRTATSCTWSRSACAISGASARRSPRSRDSRRCIPRYSRLYPGARPLSRRAARRRQPAIEAFLRAVNLNPALPASWNALQSAVSHDRPQPAEAAMAGGARRRARRAAGRGRDRHRACSPTARSTPAEHVMRQLSPDARRSRRGDAAAGQDRHEARGARRRRTAARGRAASSRPGLPRGALRLRQRA